MLNNEISRRCGASELTTFGGGGSALVYFPRNEREFIFAMEEAASDGIAPQILGGGSNVILADGELSTSIVCTRDMRGLTFEGDIVRFEAGVTVSQLMREARARGLGGLEFLEGVPATLGGALVMNAGAFGCQMADLASTARVLTERAGEFGIEERTQDLEYRRGVQGIVLGGTLRLAEIGAEESIAKRNKFIALRRAKQPRQPSCGSVFKNITLSAEEVRALELMEYASHAENTDATSNEGAFVLSAGRLLDACGLKGARAGGASISDMHANFIVNLGGATAADFLALVAIAEQAVYDKFALRLSREFVLLK